MLLEENRRSVEAEQWFRRAIKAGDSNAIYHLGLLCKPTARVEEALRWFQRAAQSGYAPAAAQVNELTRQDTRERGLSPPPWREIASMTELGIVLADGGRLRRLNSGSGARSTPVTPMRCISSR